MSFLRLPVRAASISTSPTVSAAGDAHDAPIDTIYRAWDAIDAAVLILSDVAEGGRILHANLASQRLSGYSAAELSAQPLGLLFDTASLAALHDAASAPDFATS